jgi:hypothetical protein
MSNNLEFEAIDEIAKYIKINPTSSESQCYNHLLEIYPDIKNDRFFNILFPSIYETCSGKIKKNENDESIKKK